MVLKMSRSTIHRQKPSDNQSHCSYYLGNSHCNMLGFLSEYEVFYDVLGFANFSLNEFATHAGPINKNCKSSKNDGFLPSIL